MLNYEEDISHMIRVLSLAND